MLYTVRTVVAARHRVIVAMVTAYCHMTCNFIAFVLRMASGTSRLKQTVRIAQWKHARVRDRH